MKSMNLLKDAATVHLANRFPKTSLGLTLTLTTQTTFTNTQ